jgi:hypothetical protein
MSDTPMTELLRMFMSVLFNTTVYPYRGWGLVSIVYVLPFGRFRGPYILGCVIVGDRFNKLTFTIPSSMHKSDTSYSFFFYHSLLCSVFAQ